MFESSFFDSFRLIGPKILMAVLCGGLIGLERELKQKSAGIKTNIMICVGSALFSALSDYISLAHVAQGHYGDPARLSAQIVSGIGFLGGGAIIQSRGTIHGLTTASMIWLVAAIGVSIGFGYVSIAVFVTLITVILLVVITQFETRFMGRAAVKELEIVSSDPHGAVIREIHEALEEHDLVLDDFKIDKTATQSIIRVRYHGHTHSRKKFVLDLWSSPHIREVKEI